jgi:hypothetical protein
MEKTMNKKYLLVIGGLLAALLVVGVVGATSAYAQGPDNAGFGIMMNGRGPGQGRGFGLGDAELEAAANVLGMTTDEVTSALQDGKTLQDLADTAGVDIADVQAAIQAVHETEMRDRIAQQVADGTITQAQADWMLQGIDNGYMMGKGGPGGAGRGNGGPRGQGFGPGDGSGDCPMGQTPVQNGQ